MATPQIVTVRDFTTSRYAQLADNTEGNLSDILARAESAVESQLGRGIKETEYTETMRAKTQTIFVQHRPIVDVISVQRRPNALYGWSPIASPRLYIERGPGYIEFYDSVAGYDLEITYTAGFEVVPEDLKEAIIMQAVLLSYQDLEIYGSGDAKAPGILYFKKDIESLIMPYRASATVFKG